MSELGHDKRPSADSDMKQQPTARQYILPRPPQSASRFQILNETQLNNFQREHENQRTVMKTIAHVKLIHDFFNEVGETRPIHTIEPSTLDSLLCQFYVGVRKENGEEYEPSYLRNIQGSLERHLRNRNYGYSITRSFEFNKSRQMLTSKQKDLRKQGKGNGPKTARAINDEEVDMLYQSEQLGPHDAQSLLNTLWWMNSTHFGMRVITEHHNLRWGDIIQGVCPVRGEYIEYTTERQTKTRTGADPKNVRDLHPRAYATHDQRCPVATLKLYESNRPAEFCRPEDPFYIAKKVNPKPNQKWFQRQPLGENSIAKMMRTMCKNADIADSKLTNTSARKHLLQKLNDSGVPPTHIMQISGHKNVQSVNRYSKLSHNQQFAISNIMSNNTAPSSSTYLQQLCQSDSAVRASEVRETATKSIESGTDESSKRVHTMPTTMNFLPGAHITGNVYITVNKSPETKCRKLQSTESTTTESREVVNITTTSTSSTS